MRRARSERRVLIEVFAGIERGIAMAFVSGLIVQLQMGCGFDWAMQERGARQFRGARNAGKRARRTVAAGDGLDKDLHGVVGL